MGFDALRRVEPAGGDPYPTRHSCCRKSDPTRNRSGTRHRRPTIASRRRWPDPCRCNWGTAEMGRPWVCPWSIWRWPLRPRRRDPEPAESTRSDRPFFESETIRSRKKRQRTESEEEEEDDDFCICYILGAKIWRYKVSVWPSGRRIVHVEACSALELYIWIFADVFVFILGFSCTTEFLINDSHGIWIRLWITWYMFVTCGWC